MQSILPRRKRKKRVPRACRKKIAKPSVCLASSSESDYSSDDDVEEEPKKQSEATACEPLQTPSVCPGSSSADDVGKEPPKQPKASVQEPLQKPASNSKKSDSSSVDEVKEKPLKQLEATVYVPLQRDPDIQVSEPCSSLRDFIKSVIKGHSRWEIVLVAVIVWSKKTEQTALDFLEMSPFQHVHGINYDSICFLVRMKVQNATQMWEICSPFFSTSIKQIFEANTCCIVSRKISIG